MNSKVAICAVFKDENQYVKEWADYHLNIGFDYIYIYDNMSKIPASDTLKEYIRDGKIGSEISKRTNSGRQSDCYNDSLKKLKHFDWVAYIDIDEFIVLLDNSVNIKDYLHDYSNYSAIGLNWLLFGANGHKNTQQSVLQAYTQSCPTNSANQHIKTILRPSKAICSTGPHCFKVHGGTKNINKQNINGPFNNPAILNTKMRINHYLTRSKEDFELKKKRGSGNMKDRKYDPNFFEVYQKENVQNYDILKTLEKINEKLANNNYS